MSQPDFPYSLAVAVKSIPATGRTLQVSPSAEECKAIAEFLNISAVDVLNAELVFSPWRDSGFKVTGTLKATTTLTCVVTNEQFPYSVAEEILMFFSADAANVHDENISLEDLLNDEEDAIVDPIINGQIDAGHIVTEFLALGLPTFPRKPDVDSALDNEDTVTPERENPFAALKGLVKE